MGIFVAFGSAETKASDDFSGLVAGVNAIVSPGASGPLFPLTAEWQTIVAGDEDTAPQPCTLVAARPYGNGRVVAFGHDGIFGAANFGLLDNGRFLSNTVAWLDAMGLRQVAFTSGHGEWVNGAALSSTAIVTVT